MSSDRGMHKEHAVHIYSRISLIRERNEAMPFAATWMGLKIFILSEVSHTEKYCMTSLTSRI